MILPIFNPDTKRTKMKRNGFTMKIYPGKAEEYKKRHDEIWPELSALLDDAGIVDYTIFLDEHSHVLFAYQVVKDDYDGSGLAAHPVMKKWWDYMADIMETNEDNSPKVTQLAEVYHMG